MADKHHGHQKKMKDAKNHEMGKSGSHEKARSGNLEHGKHGEGLGSGYSPPDRYQGTEDSNNSHCC